VYQRSAPSWGGILSLYADVCNQRFFDLSPGLGLPPPPFCLVSFSCVSNTVHLLLYTGQKKVSLSLIMVSKGSNRIILSSFLKTLTTQNTRPLHGIIQIQKLNSWTYNFVEVSGHNLESSQTWCFHLQYNVYIKTRFKPLLHCTHLSFWLINIKNSPPPPPIAAHIFIETQQKILFLEKNLHKCFSFSCSEVQQCNCRWHCASKCFLYCAKTKKYSFTPSTLSVKWTSFYVL
jgi:hypothetical protein